MNRRKKFYFVWVLVIYLTSYMLLTRICPLLTNSSESDLEGFVFIPVPCEVVLDSKVLTAVNRILYTVYLPLVYLDMKFTGIHHCPSKPPLKSLVAENG